MKPIVFACTLNPKESSQKGALNIYIALIIYTPSFSSIIIHSKDIIIIALSLDTTYSRRPTRVYDVCPLFCIIFFFLLGTYLN